MKRYFILVIICSIAVEVAGQKSSINHPFLELRFDEDYYTLKDSLPLPYWPDRLKYNPISSNTDWYISFGGEIRQTLETVRLGFEDQTTDAYLLSRYGIHGSLNYGRQFRIYGEVLSGLQNGRNEGPRLVDENQLYVLNLFADIELLQSGEKNLKLRLGRQEMQFGSSSLFAVRDGTNVRYTFDGLSIIYSSKKLNLKSFYAEFVRQDFGIFDDQSFTGDKMVWGSYIDYDLNNNGSLIIEPFYAGIRELSFLHQAGFPVVKDVRHSLGLRLYGKRKGWDYGIESILQTGQVAKSLNVSANQIAFKAGKSHTISNKSVFRYGLRGYYTTGDRDSLDNTINTFNPYFPLQSNLRGAFGTLTFPTNLTFTGPSFTWIFNKKLISTLSYDFYWRSAVQDGLMNPGGFPSIFPDASAQKYLGSQGDIAVVYALNKYINLITVYSHFFESNYTRARPASNSATDFFTTVVIIRI
ncbi:MAG: alginate export family protein [Bacteroidota bacterium]